MPAGAPPKVYAQKNLANSLSFTVERGLTSTFGVQKKAIRCLESPFAVRSDSNRHWRAAIYNRTIRIARPKAIRIAVKALLLLSFTIGFKSLAFAFASDWTLESLSGRDSNRAHRDI